MFVRFTVLERDPHSYGAKGLFTAAYDLLDDVELGEHDRARIREVLDWFKANLRVPPCLKKGWYPRAVCWFRPTAVRHVARMWELVWVLRGLDLRVQMHKGAEVGRVVYEDAHQVAAMPVGGAKFARRRRVAVW